jgi:hypothetical protein
MWDIKFQKMGKIFSDRPFYPIKWDKEFGLVYPTLCGEKFWELVGI